MAPTFVQATAAFDSSTTLSGAFPSPITPGNTVIGCLFFDFNDVGFAYPGVFSSADTAAFATLYNSAAAIPGSTIGAWMIAGAKVTTSGSTVSLTNPNGARGIWFALEFSGLNNDSLLDQVAVHGTGTTGAFSIGPITTTQASELLLAVLGGAGGSTLTASTPSGYTQNFSGSVSELGATLALEQDQAVSSIDTYTYTTTLGGNSSFMAGVLLSLNAAPPTHAISGNAGLADATVSYTGTSSGEVTADGSGNYTIPDLMDGDYTITPTFTGYVFTPASQDETLAGADITGVDFTASLGVYSVPDCRNYATFPNASRNVQGTLTYDVQTSSNSTVPSTDSRAAGAPVDSRTAPNIPENSRAPQ